MNFEEDILACVEVLQKGGVILYPTDTIWGLGCDASNEHAVQRIHDIKKRPTNKSYIALLPDSLSLLHYVAAPPPHIDELLSQYADRPTTIIYPQALQIADNAMAQDGSMAFRICKEEFCFALLKRFRKSIISTSANFSGEPSPSFFAQIKGELIAQVDYVVRHRQQDTTPTLPSRILKWDDENGSMVTIRE